MKLSKLMKTKVIKKSKKLGRGYGSGRGGHTVGRGTKGQKARSGKSIPTGFEGGQTPLYKRLPQWGGFKNPTTKQIAVVSLSKLNVFKANSKATPQDLVEKKLLKKIPKYGVKILGNGDLEKKLKLEGFLFSKSAREKVEAAGGTILE
jgi:large subunit ribosomal protein L15